MGNGAGCRNLATHSPSRVAADDRSRVQGPDRSPLSRRLHGSHAGALSAGHAKWARRVHFTTPGAPKWRDQALSQEKHKHDATHQNARPVTGYPPSRRTRSFLTPSINLQDVAPDKTHTDRSSTPRDRRTSYHKRGTGGVAGRSLEGELGPYKSA